ncbi:MAG TPA: hypothetical protein VG675_23220 [Bryobacteraceae bacterium]|nr:hypothetical protein [Bryobacteraceae bacterium]
MSERAPLRHGGRLLAALLLPLLISAAPPPAPSDENARELCGEIAGIAQELTSISGMRLKHPVPCDFISKDKVNQFLKERVHEVASPEDIRAEELTLKKFGLVPQDFDLAKTTVDLLTEQAAAFYDYDKKKLFITDSTPSDSQEAVLAHELSHAIADQNFNLSHFIRKGHQNDDSSTARLAVMEGQATWLMSEYLARRAGQSLSNSPSLAEMMSHLSESGAGQYPVFDKSPLYLRETLVFPYTKGMLFQNAVNRHDGQAGFAEVFEDPPVSTQQILHPEKYFSHVKPTDPKLPDPHLPHGYKSLIGGTLGELDHAVLLRQFVGNERAEKIASHWRGSNFELRENKKAERVVLLYAAEWDTPEAARWYFDAYREALRKKWKKMQVASETPDLVTGEGDDGRFELSLQGAIVTSVEGLDPAVN